MAKVRYTYIENLVLQIYKRLPEVRFPIILKDVIAQFPNCRIMTYQKLARVAGCSLRDVIMVCESKSGCTHYDKENDRYLILFNSSTADNNNIGRQRWTCAHEIGHVACCHMEPYMQKIAENGLFEEDNRLLEEEADYFAATLLAPLPLYKQLGIHSPADIQRIFGLSAEAAANRYSNYLKWSAYGNQRAWANDMRRVYLLRHDVIDVMHSPSIAVDS